MTRTPHLGAVSVSVIAGEIEVTNTPITLTPSLGQQVVMGNSGLYFHIKPEVARQWVSVLEPIAKEND